MSGDLGDPVSQPKVAVVFLMAACQEISWDDLAVCRSSGDGPFIDVSAVSAVADFKSTWWRGSRGKGKRTGHQWQPDGVISVSVI